MDDQFWFGLWIFGFLPIFLLYSQAVIPRTIVDFPAFLEYGLVEGSRFVHNAHTTFDPNMEDG